MSNQHSVFRGRVACACRPKVVRSASPRYEKRAFRLLGSWNCRHRASALILVVTAKSPSRHYAGYSEVCHYE